MKVVTKKGGLTYADDADEPPDQGPSTETGKRARDSEDILKDVRQKSSPVKEAGIRSQVLAALQDSIESIATEFGERMLKALSTNVDLMSYRSSVIELMKLGHSFEKSQNMVSMMNKAAV